MPWVLPLLVGAAFLLAGMSRFSGSPASAAAGLVIGGGFISLSYYLRVRR